MTVQIWREYTIAPDGTHHVHRGRPAYTSRFHEALKFHPPGLAPVSDASGAYHVTPDGLPAYPERYLRAFGFYEDRAAVHSDAGWLHILPDGSRLYTQTYAWCGNFQGGRCSVRQFGGSYLHIDQDGAPAYQERYRYAGDFRDGAAVAQRDDGQHTHIDAQGSLIHGIWFDDLDVFHKGYARACDSAGWLHVNMRGQPIYETRFKSVEPFYNGQARVEGFDGSLSIINESGATLLTLRPPRSSPLDTLSSDMVGLWRTQTIRAAVELGVFEILPARSDTVESRTGLAPSMGARLMRALQELDLARLDDDSVYHTTERGILLARAHPFSLADAALMWGKEHYSAWSGIVESLRSGESSFHKMSGQNIFDWIAGRPGELETFQSAFSTYAKHDYRALPEKLDFGVHSAILDAGGGRGDLVFTLLRAFPALRGVVMDRAEVVESLKPPRALAARCQFVAGDLFAEWPASADAVILARVLHDWPDHDALRILERARDAIDERGKLYLVEMTLDESSGSGGLLDMNMLVMTGGAERTERQFAQMLEAAGFRMQKTLPTGFVSSIIVASPA